MNIVLLEESEKNKTCWMIRDQRQLAHICTHLKAKVGDTLKIGIKNGPRYVAEVVTIAPKEIQIKALKNVSVPEKHPITLIVALPRPKVLRRLIMDSVTLGVEKIILLHSFRVDKSYWQSPFLKQINDYVMLGLEQAGDTYVPQIECYQRFKPFVEDILPQLIQQKDWAYVAHPYVENTLPKEIVSKNGIIIIGPEGGFIPYEVDLLIKNGCQAIQFGNRILRTETAVSYLLGRLSV